jgi:hypothetical protein
MLSWDFWNKGWKFLEIFDKNFPKFFFENALENFKFLIKKYSKFPSLEFAAISA